MAYNKEDIIFELVRNAIRTKYSDLPSDVIQITKRFILDTIGTAFAGSSAPGCRNIVDLINKRGGKKESTIWIHGGKVPSECAAFANSVMAHAQDFDDTHDKAVLHANTSVLPAALALAERESKNGKDLLTAVALGVDFFCRMGLASLSLGGWVFSSTIAYFASTVASCKILNFDETKTVNALGIVYSQVAGNIQCLIDETLTKRIQPGLGARAGVFSSLLSDVGITGPSNILEGKYGFFNLYQNGKYDQNTLLAELGKHFEGTNLSMKPYPCCRATHAAIDVALEYVRKEKVQENEIDNITFYVPPIVKDLVGRPFEIGANPQVDAQFSIPYTVATAIIKKDVFLQDFKENIVRSSPALNLAKRITVIEDKKIEDTKALAPVTMQIKMKNGRVVSKQASTIKGSPDNPMTMQESIEKFKKCVEYSEKPLSKSKIEDSINIIINLDEVQNISQLLKLLV